MAKQKSPKIDPVFMEDCLWMSIRYCIGRKSIAACTHAAEVAVFLAQNPGFIRDTRFEFLATDIRREINTHIGFSSNIHINGFDGPKDALTLLCEEIDRILKDSGAIIDTNRDNWGKEPVEGFFNPGHYDWYIDLRTGKVEAEPIKPSQRYIFDIFDITDYIPWVKLANYISPNEIIQAPDGPKSGFKFPILGRYQGEEYMHFAMVSTTPEMYIQNPSHDIYIDPNYIKNE